jgi:hypothetical protein
VLWSGASQWGDSIRLALAVAMVCAFAEYTKRRTLATLIQTMLAGLSPRARMRGPRLRERLSAGGAAAGCPRLAAPKRQGQQVEVLWWSHRDRWDHIADFGPMAMPLDEALEYVAKDPISFPDPFTRKAEGTISGRHNATKCLSPLTRKRYPKKALAWWLAAMVTAKPWPMTATSRALPGWYTVVGSALGGCHVTGEACSRPLLSTGRRASLGAL